MSKPDFLCKAIAMCILGVWASLTIADQNTDPFIQDFNNSEIGIAFAMLSQNSWENPGHQIFHSDPSTPQKSLQAVTLSNATKKIMPYQGDTRYGLAFSIAESSGFYKYFATKSEFTTPCSAGMATMVSPITESPAEQYSQISNWAVSCSGNDAGEQIAFCGRCFDGGVCAGSGNTPNSPDVLWPALGDQVPFTEFQKAKNAIVSASGSKQPTCKWATASNIWNEFDTNGLSPTALVGVLIDHTSTPPPDSWTPSDSTLCNYLQTVDSSRKNWPVYTLTFTQSNDAPSSLTLTRTLNQIINTLTINEDAGWFSVVRTGQSDPSAAAVGFVNLNAYVNGQGGFQIVGQVANQAELSLAFVRVQAKLFDASDQLITEQDTFIPTDLLAPGEFAPFSITFADGLPSNAVRYDLEAAGRYAGESDETFYGPNNFEVVSGADFNDNGALVISGDVTNTGDNTANLVKVVITVFDEDGRVAGAASDLVENQQLGPGESSPYSVTFAELGGSAANFLVSVQGVVES